MVIPKSDTEPVAESVTKPVAQPIAEPDTQPVSEPNTQPVADAAPRTFDEHRVAGRSRQLGSRGQLLGRQSDGRVRPWHRQPALSQDVGRHTVGWLGGAGWRPHLRTGGYLVGREPDRRIRPLRRPGGS